MTADLLSRAIEKLERLRARLSKRLLDRQRQAGWPDMHPEDICHRCGGRNIVWAVDPDVWDPIMRPHGPDSPWLWNEIICPQCFAELFEARFPATAWLLAPDENTRGAIAFRQRAILGSDK